MKTRHLTLSLLLMIAFVLGACGPSAEEIAAMTASAWTPTPNPTSTPPPTATAIPLPIDLTVTVADEAGNPIAGASIAYPASGSPQPSQTDGSGQAMWMNLPQASGKLTVAAPGYSSSESTLDLVPGSNELSVTLTRVPFGLTAADACAPGESTLYVEDFQVGAVNNWDAYPPGTPLRLVDDIVNPGDQILAIDFGSSDGEFTLRAGPFQSGVVLRFWYRPGDHARFHVSWVGEASMNADGFVFNDYSSGATFTGKPVMQQGVWHLMEVSTIGDTIEFWVDGALNITAQSPTISSGTKLGFGSAFLPPESISYINNISICGLNGGSFTSMYIAP